MIPRLVPVVLEQVEEQVEKSNRLPPTVLTVILTKFNKHQI